MARIWRDKWGYQKQRVPAGEPENGDAPSGIIVAGDFRIDRDTRSATVRGHQVQLTPAEFDVLVYLTSHRKRVVTSRTTLAISEDQGVRQTEFLRNLLSLRKKLEEEVPKAHYVQTEAWILYDFDPGTSASPEKGV
jgi:DNA-binding response OmpR family regulator